jgi:hypothetical protein
MKDVEFHFTERILGMIAKFSDDLALEDVQGVFENGRHILNGSLQMEENTSSSQSSFELNYSTDLEMRQGAQTSCTRYIFGARQGTTAAHRPQNLSVHPV